MTYTISERQLRSSPVGPDPAWALEHPGTALSIPEVVRSLSVRKREIDSAVALQTVHELLLCKPRRIQLAYSVALVTADNDNPGVPFRLRGDIGYSKRADSSNTTIRP